jgi:hypothetical protein
MAVVRYKRLGDAFQGVDLVGPDGLIAHQAGEQY